MSGTILTQPGAVPDNYDPEQQIQLQPAHVITQQPGKPLESARGVVWMPIPPTIPGVPTGLEYLTYLESVTIHQIKEMLEIMTGFETKNKYVLMNANGEQCYYAFEESDFCDRQFCGASRAFKMHIVDNFKREVLTINRSFACLSGGCGGCCAWMSCCQQECTVGTPSDGPLGTVRQRLGCMSSSLDVLDKDGQVVFVIDGPDCFGPLGCGDHEFQIRTPGDGKAIGAITQKWGGILREAFSDADTFIVTFPKDLDVNLKGVLLGATFLIDFIAFERNDN